MTFWNDLESKFHETETDVMALVVDFKNGLAIAKEDSDAAIKWLAKQAPTIAASLASVLSLATQLGVTSNPEFGAAVAAANLAVDGLNALAGAVNAGHSDAQAVVSGVVAVKQANAALNSATAAAVTATKAP